MKILVTGGAGFIGSSVVESYLQAGHEVAILDNLSTGMKANIPKEAQFHELDLVSGDLDSLFQKEKFDVVNHHAAQIDVRVSFKEPSKDVLINLFGGTRLLECCEKYKIKKFIFSSTGGAIYGEQVHFPASEEHPIQPCSPYGLDKYLFEHYLTYYNRRGLFDTISLRYANVYGPRQNPHGEAGVVAIFIEHLLGNKIPTINGDGKQTRDFIYVGDIASANLKALDLTGAVTLNLGTGIETDINTIYQLIAKSMGNELQAKHGPAKSGEQMRSVITFDKAEKLLGWRPQMSLKEGIPKTVAWFTSNCEKSA